MVCLSLAAALGGRNNTPTGAAFAATTTNDSNSLGLATVAAPTGLTADRATPGQVALSWTASSSSFVTGYTVYRSTSSGCCYTSYATVSGLNTTTYTDNSIATGITWVGQSTLVQTTDLGSMTLPVPSGVTAGDVLVVHLGIAQSATASAPTGWTLLTSGNAFSNVSSAVLYRVAGASEPASYTFSWTGSHESVGAMLAYRYVDGTTPIQTWATGTGSSATPTAPSVTTTKANTVVLRFMSAEKANLPTPASGAYPSGTTGRYAQQATGADPVNHAGAEKLQVSAGSAGTAAFSLSAASDWLGTTVALNPTTTGFYYVVQATYLGWTSVSSTEA